MQKALSLESLGELDGGTARLIVDAAIAQAVADVDDRGDDGKPRSVVITLNLSRLDNGMLSSHLETQVKMPARKTAQTLGIVRSAAGRPGMIFQSMDPADPTQKTIDELA